MAGIDHNRVVVAQTGERIRRRGRTTDGRGGGSGGGSGGRGRGGDGSRDGELLEARGPRTPVIPRAQRPWQAVGEPVQRQEQRVPRDVGLSHELVDHAAGAYERRAELEHEDRATERHGGARPFDDHGEAERPREQGCRHGRAAALRRNRDDRLAARCDNDDRLRRSDEQEEAGEADHPRRARV